MRTRLALVMFAAGVTLAGASPALAQGLPDVPGIDAARDQVAEQPSAARAPSAPAGGLPGAGAIPDLERPAAAVPTARGTGSPTRLPETGVDVTALALDGLTILGAGTLLLAVRRRLAGTSA